MDGLVAGQQKPLPRALLLGIKQVFVLRQLNDHSQHVPGVENLFQHTRIYGLQMVV